MNRICQKKLLDASKNASKQGIDYIKLLLNQKCVIKNIFDLADILNTSKSSASRFVLKIGFDSFKQFKLGFNEGSSKSKNIEFEEFTKNGVAIISSKKSDMAARLLYYRLRVKVKDAVLFDGQNKNIDNFIQKNKNKSFILFSVTGDSHRFSKSLVLINDLIKKPNVLISTFSDKINIFNDYDYINLINVSKTNFKPKDWLSINIALLEMVLGVFKWFKVTT